ncbi:MAG: DUF2156 domain-containing protein [Thermoplasmata archaeon]
MKEFPEFEPLTLEHRYLLRESLLNANPTISEMCFGNLYIWQDTYPAYVSMIEDSYILRGENAFLVPVCERNHEKTIHLIEKIEGYCTNQKKDVIFKYTPAQCANVLKTRGYEVIPDRDNWDYLYLTEHLAELQGQKYYSKRKDIKKFMVATNEKAEFLPLAENHLLECLEINRNWLKEKKREDENYLAGEQLALTRALKDYSALEFIGFAVLLDGDVIGFTIGEQLNRETVVVHFEKGDYRYPGIYQYINQKFADAMLGKFKYINREQDLGIPGLRKAKESYHPIAMVEKFTCIKRA